MKKRISMFAVLAVLISMPCFAQQIDEEVVDDGNVQSRMIIASDDGSGEAPQVAFMSSDGATMGEMVFTSDFGGDLRMGAPDVFSLAQNGGVQKEIELVDEQLDQLKQINADFSKRIQDQMAEMRTDKGNFDISRAKGLSEMIKKINEEKNARMQEVFLPHQFERLQQISLQTQMRRRGDSNLLSNKKVVEALGLSDKQQKQLKKRAKELKAELEEDIKKLKERARDDLFGELTSEQRKKLKSMLGDDFELKTTSIRDRIRRARDKKAEDTTEDK